MITLATIGFIVNHLALWFICIAIVFVLHHFINFKRPIHKANKLFLMVCVATWVVKMVNMFEKTYWFTLIIKKWIL